MKLFSVVNVALLSVLFCKFAYSARLYPDQTSHETGYYFAPTVSHFVDNRIPSAYCANEGGFEDTENWSDIFTNWNVKWDVSVISVYNGRRLTFLANTAKNFLTADENIQTSEQSNIVSKGPIINVESFGFSTSGTARNNSTVWNKNVVSGKRYYVPSGVFYIGAKLIIPDNTVIHGGGKRNTIFKKAFNGEMAEFGDGAALYEATFDGNGANYKGKGFVIHGEKGRQTIGHVRVIETEDYAVSFDILAGSQSSWYDVELYQNDGFDEGQYAVYIPNIFNNTGKPRHFHNVQTTGRKFIDLGGSNGTFISNSFIGEVKFRSESRGIQITTSRVGVNQTTMMEINGYNVSLSGNNIGPSITLMPGTVNVALVGNTYNGQVYDNSTTYANAVEIPYRQYIPLISSSGKPPFVGNAVARGVYSRIVGTVTLCLNFTMGSMTSLGTGDITFSIPNEIAPINAYQQVYVGSVYARDVSNSKLNVGVMKVTPKDNVISFNFEGSTGGLQWSWPFVWAVNDNLRGCITYLR